MSATFFRFGRRKETPTARTAPPIDLIAAAAKSRPNASALRAGAARMTYRELMFAVDGLADALVALGVGRDVPVGICLDRSFEFVVAMLAAARAGGAFLPLDPDWPLDRLRFILEDARAPVVLTSPERRDALAGYGRKVLCPNGNMRAPSAPAPRAGGAATPADLAYVIYTSGSTGTPKGVEITGANLRNLMSWQWAAFGVSARDCASCVAGLGFDAVVWETWPYLAKGACVALPEATVRGSAETLRRWLVQERITVAFVPTPLAEPMIATPWPMSTALRYLLTGGDVLHARPIEGLPFAVVNNYGPTECTVVATSGIVAPRAADEDLPSIGHPIDGVRIDIVDARGDATRLGEIGEICIGGAGVARGYRHRPALTAENFVADRFARDGSAGRIYRTGDLGRWLPNGEIAFHGRQDEQVKMRGHRVELAEISAVLDRHPLVLQSVVVQGAGEAADRLVAYVVPAASARPSADELRDFLASRLPASMLPSVLVAVSSLPLNASGKIDRTALPPPSEANALPETAHRPPSTDVEMQLAEIVGELLGLDGVGVDDNFFLLGGHSLLGTQLVLRARDAFGAELTLRDLFQAQTVAKLAARIERRIIERLSLPESIGVAGFQPG